MLTLQYYEVVEQSDGSNLLGWCNEGTNLGGMQKFIQITSWSRIDLLGAGPWHRQEDALVRRCKGSPELCQRPLQMLY